MALGSSACTRTSSLRVDDCSAPANAADAGRCALEEAQRLEAELADEEARLVGALERHGEAETGTGQSLVEEFRRAQRAWLAYKDAECSYAYAKAFGGELRGLNAASCLRDLLRERLARVRAERERQEQ